MTCKFLLIDNSRNALRRMSALHVALKNLGTLSITSSKDAPKVLRKNYDLVIIDTIAIEDPIELITTLLAVKKVLWITVTAYTPTWQEAREVFRAGAIDYYERLQEIRHLTETIRNTLTIIGDPNMSRR